MSDSMTTFGALVAGGYLEFGDGYRTKRSEHGRPGLPILRVAEVLDGKIAPTFEDYVSNEYRRAMGAKISQPGDIVLTTKGTVGRVAIMPSDGPQFVYSPQLCYFRLRSGSPLDARYLYYWFKSDFFWSQADSRKSQTDMADYLSLSDIRSIQISLPPISVQRSIARVLAALDDKIAVNERIVRTSDELRRLLFANFLAIRAECTEERPLTWFAEFINGRAFTKGATGTGRMVVRIAELNSGPGGSTVYNDIDVPDRHLARPGDVLFAWSGSLTVARWYREEAIINQHIFKVIPKRGVPVWLAYELVLSKLATFKSIAADKATTMGHIQRHHLEEPVVAPTADVIPSLHQELGPLWDRALAAEQESLALARLRDELLPGLMSGAIRVRDAEKIAEDVT